MGRAVSEGQPVPENLADESVDVFVRLVYGRVGVVAGVHPHGVGEDLVSPHYPHRVVVAGDNPHLEGVVPVDRLGFPQRPKVSVRVGKDLGRKHVVVYGCCHNAASQRCAAIVQEPLLWGLDGPSAPPQLDDGGIEAIIGSGLDMTGWRS